MAGGAARAARRREGAHAPHDELARMRRELPWVRVDKDYAFDTDEGDASLADLFRVRSQLLVYHFKLGPEYKAGCPSCSAIADVDGVVYHTYSAYARGLGDVLVAGRAPKGRNESGNWIRRHNEYGD
jgi:predicted dithiol-disulfide oxidoreductase (DUF899 family)